MIYTNVSGKKVVISKDMVKTVVCAGADVNLSPSDIRNSKSGMRFFESRQKREAVVCDKAFVVAASDDCEPQATESQPELVTELVPELVPATVVPEVQPQTEDLSADMLDEIQITTEVNDEDIR